MVGEMEQEQLTFEKEVQELSNRIRKFKVASACRNKELKEKNCHIHD